MVPFNADCLHIHIHWEEFAKSHSLSQCEDCHAVRLVCVAEEDEKAEKCIDTHS